MISYILFVFFILLSATDGEATTAYKPTDVFLINCGSISDTIDTDGRTWTPELRKVFVSNLVNASFPSKASKEEPSVPEVPYMTARIFRSNFSYIFPVSPGLKFLRLYFYPTRYGFDLDAVNSFFSITVNGFTIMRDFSADLTAKASKSTSLIKEFIIPVSGGDKTLNLTLMPSPNSLAFLNGVEIVSMPDRLYTKGGFNDYIRDVGSTNDFEIDNITALETVYRLNVGGQMVNGVGDSGMFREWISDNEFIPGQLSFLRANNKPPFSFKRRPDPNLKINYTEKTPSYVAPEEVYRTFGSMGNTNRSELNLNFNMTWLFPVDAGFNYLVRLHFCETLPEVTKPGQRIFSIFIGNQIATLNTDVIYLSGGSRKPMYLDFNTFMASSAKQRGERQDLRLDLYPYKDGKPEFYNAILNGIEILKLNDTNGNLAEPNPYPKTLEAKLSILMITLIALGSVTGLVTSIILLMLLMRQIRRKKNRKDNSIVMFKVLLRQYTYAELKKITKSFSHIVGKGGFGTVYGGNLCNGRRVAVKVLKDLKGNGEDFINEVTSMSQTSHVNIVSLLGFCHEGAKRAIVYEFLENGSLDQFISKDKSLTHDVTTLFGIALGIARGLEYLHYGCKTRIVHFDIKPQNILLDDNFCPKVSDFGLAKLCEKRESIMSLIDTRGTIGYIAPEVVSRMYGGISHKSDVYSYGMLVLDMIGARNKAETTTSNGSSAYFPDWIYKDLENGGQTWIIGTNEEEKEIVEKLILVSLWCIQPRPLDRPPMNRIVEMIEGSLDALAIPPKPSMHISAELILESSSFSDGEDALEISPKLSME